MDTAQPSGFNRRVYAVVARIPHGRVAYGQVGELIAA